MRGWIRLLWWGVLAGCATGAPRTDSPSAPAAAAATDVQVATALPERPLPQPLEVPRSFQEAIDRGTRTLTGRTGPRYWQNTASYEITTRLDEVAKRLEGSARIVYRNASPDVLQNLNLELAQNFHQGGVVRFEPAEITGGMELSRVQVDGQVLTAASSGPRYEVMGTRLAVVPPRPLGPGGGTTIEIDWSFTIPQTGAGARMGWARDDLFFLAYWYPQMAVYDDVEGWHTDPFTGTTEFYADFASYDVTIEAPAQWVVMATGELQNAGEVLAPEVIDRVRRAEESDTAVHILTEADFDRATLPGTNGRLHWHFMADSVRDFTFSVTRRSLWDAQRTPVTDRDGDGQTDYTRVDALYRTTAPFWRNASHYAAHSIDFLSRFTGLPYPWPHMSAVEAGEIIGGGMEFPMLTLIGDYNTRGDSALYYVVAHELAHMWVPMMVSSNERRYSWMDEGTTTFNENQARMEFYPGANHNLTDQQGYLQLAVRDGEGEMMRHSAYHYDPGAYGIASYSKPATVLVALRAVLGEEVFMRAYREFLRRWQYRHPYPWDLWGTIEDVSGRDLDWFWQSWYYETWTLDHAVGEVSPTAQGVRVTVEDRGLVPMPVQLVLTMENGQEIRRVVPVDEWLAGKRSLTVDVATSSPVTRVEIDPARDFPDVDRSNNVWWR